VCVCVCVCVWDLGLGSMGLGTWDLGEGVLADFICRVCTCVQGHTVQQAAMMSEENVVRQEAPGPSELPPLCLVCSRHFKKNVYHSPANCYAMPDTVGQGTVKTGIKKDMQPGGSASHVKQWCAGCGDDLATKSEAKRCNGCKIAKYCSRACQKLHWNDQEHGHKELCRGVYDRVPLFADPTGLAEAVCVQAKRSAENAVIESIRVRRLAIRARHSRETV
jgi:hypothetical protein